MEGEAVNDLREHQIEKDHSWAQPAPEDTQRLHPIWCARDVEALGPQDGAERIANLVVVLDEQNRRSSHLASPSRGMRPVNSLTQDEPWEPPRERLVIHHPVRASHPPEP
jgi:hypothetical protein